MENINDDSGWVKIYRRMLDWEWYDDINTKALFLHCLLKANHKEKEWRGQVIERGQFVTSLAYLSVQTQLSVQQVKTALNKLKSTGEITSKQQARGRMITVVKYDQYQASNKPATNNQQADNKLITSKQQANNNKQECKEYKNEKNEKNEKKKRARAKPDQAQALSLGGENPKVNRQAWNDYVNHRAEIKKPMSPAAAKRAINVLEILSPNDQQATVDKTILNGWTGLFPEKSMQNNQPDYDPILEANKRHYQEIFGKPMSNVIEGEFK